MMDRTQKKCVLASFGVHSLLFVLLLVGPTLLRSKQVVDTSPILDFIPIETTYEDAKGGGDPKGATPAAEPPKPVPPQPKPPESKPEPVIKPEPKLETKKVEPEVQKEPAVRQLVNPDALEPIEKQSRLPEVSTKVVTRKDNQVEKKKQAEQAAKAEAKRRADARKRMADTITQAANNIANGVSPGIDEIKLKGPGGGGIPYANFFQAVKSVYSRAWVLPDGVTDDQATTTATVLIARDGTVVNARITTFSRNPVVDNSVQATLDRVKFAAPLPDSEVKDQREVTINFNVKAKRASG